MHASSKQRPAASDEDAMARRQGASVHTHTHCAGTQGPAQLCRESCLHARAQKEAQRRWTLTAGEGSEATRPRVCLCCVRGVSRRTKRGLSSVKSRQTGAHAIGCALERFDAQPIMSVQLGNRPSGSLRCPIHGEGETIVGRRLGRAQRQRVSEREGEKRVFRPTPLFSPAFFIVLHPKAGASSVKVENG